MNYKTKMHNIRQLHCLSISSFRYDTYEDIERITNDILSRVKCRPKLAIICGSGLGHLADTVEDKEIVSYFDIEGFPVSTGLLLFLLFFCCWKFELIHFSSIPLSCHQGQKKFWCREVIYYDPLSLQQIEIQFFKGFVKFREQILSVSK